jgi:hypothetical protein
MSTLLRISIAAIVITPLGACAVNQPTGATFTPRTPPSADRALVYLYRPAGEKHGYDRTYFLAVNQRKVVDLLHGGYFAYETDPGKLALLSDVNRTARTMMPLIGAVIEAIANPQAAKLEIDVEPGKIYYVRMHPEASATHFTPTLSLVSPEVGESEIARCKQITNNP